MSLRRGEAAEAEEGGGVFSAFAMQKAAEASADASSSSALGILAQTVCGGIFALLGFCVLLSIAWKLTTTIREALAAAVQAEATKENPASAPLLGKANKRSCRAWVYNFINGKTNGRVGHYLMVGMIGISVGGFILSTRLNQTDTEKLVLSSVEYVMAPLFSLELILRIWTCVEETHDVAPRAPRLYWVFTNVYVLIDIASVLPFWYDLFAPGDTSGIRWTCLRMFRIMEIMKDDGAGIGVFAGIFSAQKEVLAASFFAGGVILLVCSSLYHFFDRGNPAMIFCPLCEDPGDSGSCNGADQIASCYGRMDSIPSAMFYCLLNLFGEYPLMQEHSVGSRCVGIFIVLVGQAVVGIATGVIGNGFADYVDDMNDEEEKEEPVERGPSVYQDVSYERDSGIRGGGGGGAAQAELYGKIGDQAAVAYASEKRASEYIDWWDDKDGWWACVVNLLVVAGWIQFLVVQHTVVVHAEVMGSKTLVGKHKQSFEQQGAALGGDLDFGDFGVTMINWSGPFEAFCALLFAMEYAVRLAAARREWGPLATYASSGMGLIDFLAFAPALLVVIFPSYAGDWIWPVAHLARMFKLERYLRAFGAFFAVFKKGSGVFLTAGIVAGVLLVIFSSMLWYFESNAPVEEIRDNMESIPKAMWMTLLHLTGECPIVDYTIAGKMMLCFIGMFAVNIFGIPFGLMSDGFAGYMEADNDIAAIRDQTAEADQELQRLHDLMKKSVGKSRPGCTKMAKFLKGCQSKNQSDLALRFESFAILMIFVSLGASVYESLDGFQQETIPLFGPATLREKLPTIGELFIVYWFTLEFLMRFYAAPAIEGYWSRRRYVLSFMGVIDLICIVPFYLAQFHGSSIQILDEFGAVADRHDEELRMFRILRLLQLSNYAPTVGLILRVFTNPQIRADLVTATFVAASALFIFATVLHATEIHNEDPEMCLRFRSIVSALPFTLMHLTGDYPLTDYTLPGRYVNVCMIVVANGMVGLVGGVIASGFTQELQEFREFEREKRRKASAVLGKVVKQWLMRRRFRKLNEGLKFQQEQQKLLLAARERQSGFMWRVQNTLKSKSLVKYRLLLILMNIAAVLLESEKEIAANYHPYFKIFELASVVVFTVEYAATFYSAPVCSDYANNRWVYALSFFGIVDFMTILPFWAQVVLGAFGFKADFYIFKILRSLRILQLEDFVQAFTLLDDTWTNCKDTIFASGLMALIIWFLGAVAFFECEQGNPALEGAMDSIPSALHYAAIFTGGEWAVVDFTPEGKVVAMLYCLLGIAIFSIPVGGFFEAFEATLCSRCQGLGDADAKDQPTK